MTLVVFDDQPGSYILFEKRTEIGTRFVTRFIVGYTKKNILYVSFPVTSHVFNF